MPINFSCKNISSINLSDISTIEKQNSQNPWSLKTLENTLNNKNIMAKNILNNNQSIAYVFILQVIDEAEILNISVSQKYQKLGLATQLLNVCEKELKQKKINKLFLEVRKSNLFALNLYKKLNFKQYSIRKKYYKPLKGGISEDALLFIKTL